MWWMIKNSRDKKDALLTFAVAAVVVILIKVLLHGVTITIGTKVFSMGAVDAGIVAAVLGPTLGAYTTKRVMLAPGGDRTEHPTERDA